MTISVDLLSPINILIHLNPYKVAAGAVETQYIATNQDYFTTSAQTPANDVFRAVVQNGFSMRRSALDTSGLSRRGFPGYGAITIINAAPDGYDEGPFDDWIDPMQYTWEGRTFEAYFVQKNVFLNEWDYAGRVQIGQGFIDDINYDRDTITLQLKDGLFRLDKLLQVNYYGGTGGTDGTAALKGKPKPICLGKAFNIAPVAADPVNLIYQIHDGAINSISEVRDKGVPLITTGTATAGAASTITLNSSSTSGYSTFDPNTLPGTYYIGASVTITGGTGSGQTRTVTNFNPATRVLTVSPNWTVNPNATSTYKVNEWVEDLSNGRFTLFSQPDGLVTCDCIGATWTDAFYSGSYKTLALMVKVIRDYGGVISTEVQYDDTAVPTHNAGYYTTETVNILDCLDQLAASEKIFYNVNREGKFSFGLLRPPVQDAGPTGDDATLTFIGQYDRENNTLQRENFLQVRYATIYNYRRNWTVQDASSLSPLVPESARLSFSTEYRTVRIEDSGIPTVFAGAIEAQEYSLIYEDADASTVATDLNDAFKEKHGVYSFTAFSKAFSYNLGDEIRLYSPRMNLQGITPGNGAAALVVETEDDYSTGRCNVKVLI